MSNLFGQRAVSGGKVDIIALAEKLAVRPLGPAPF